MNFTRTLYTALFNSRNLSLIPYPRNHFPTWDSSISCWLRYLLILPMATAPWMSEAIPYGSRNSGPRRVLNSVSEVNATLINYARILICTEVKQLVG